MATLTHQVSAVTIVSGPIYVFPSAFLPVDVLNDNADTSYVQLWQANDAGAKQVKLAFYDFTVPVGAKITSLTITLRARSHIPYGPPSGGTVFFYAKVIPSTGGSVSSSANMKIGGNRIITDFNMPVDITGLTTANINDLVLGVADWGGIYAVDLMRATATLTYNEAPAVTITSPTGTRFNNKPNVSWTYSDPERQNQSRYRIRVFNATQYSAGGFNPETSPATWDSGEVFSTAKKVPIGIALPDQTYRVYVRAADNTGLYSLSGVYSQFQVVSLPPSIPTYTVPGPWSPPQNIMTFYGHENQLSLNQSSIETDTTDWVGAPGTTISKTTDQFLVGIASMQLLNSSGGTANISSQTTISDDLRVSVGTTYTARASFRAAATARSCRVIINWWNSLGQPVGTQAVGTNVTDGTGGWIEATVSGVAPANAHWATVVAEIVATAASEVHYVDKIALAPGTVSETPWTTGGYTGTSYLEVQRSSDGGVTWSAVRGANGTTTGLLPLNQTVPLTDHEFPLNVAILYRARLVGYQVADEPSYGPFTVNISAATYPSKDWWLKDTGTPANNQIFPVLDKHNITIKSQEAVYYALGRKFPIVVSDVANGEDGGINYDVQTQAQWLLVKKLLTSTNVLLLQSPYNGDQWYIRIIGDREITMHNTEVTAPYRTGEFTYVEVSSGI